MPPVLTKMEQLYGTRDVPRESIEDEFDGSDDRKRKEALEEEVLDIETEKFFNAAMFSCRSDSIDSSASGDVRADTTKTYDYGTRRSTRPMLKMPTTDHGRYDLEPSSSEDVLDGGFFGSSNTADVDDLPPHSSLPYAEKPEDEQEALAKYVAGKLNEMAMEVERTHGPRSLPSVSDLLHLDSYDSFSALISEAVGTDPSSTQLALFFRLAQDIVSSEAAKGVVGWAKKYYRQKLARWVVRKNGLESCVASPVNAVNNPPPGGPEVDDSYDCI